MSLGRVREAARQLWTCGRRRAGHQAHFGVSSKRVACARWPAGGTMDIFDRHIAPPGGGPAASGGIFYHVSFRSGSRATGASAKSAHNYIAREGEYGEGDRDPVV
jgi:hypothetical protein